MNYHIPDDKTLDSITIPHWIVINPVPRKYYGPSIVEMVKDLPVLGPTTEKGSK